MKVMSGLDARFLYSSTPTVHMHTMKVVVVDVGGRSEPLTDELLAAILEDRLGRMPMLRRRIVPVLGGLGNPVVVDDPDFVLSRHLRVLTIDAPGERAQLDRVIGDIAGVPLPRDRPLWQLTVVQGLAGDRVAFVMKLHHALADGVASVAMLENAFIVDEADAVVEPFRPEVVPTGRALYRSTARSAARAARTLPRVLRETVTGARQARAIRRETSAPLARPFSGPRTPFNVALSADRTFATLSLDMATVRQVRTEAGVTLNDAFLAICAGGIRRHLARTGDLPAESLVASVPMATRTERYRLGGNHVDNLFMPLHTEVADPAARAREISSASAAARRIRTAFGPELFELRSGLVPAGFHGIAPHLWGATHLANHLRPPLNLIASCVRGPRQPMEVDGAVVTALYSCGPILEGIGVNITAWSYVDSLDVSILGCSASLPDPALLAQDLHDELDAWVALL
ncbi:MAG: wax ester/triacylglycerol synthase family O-acyltransferase [Actinobacteria bacterium]|nr:wax ester/triacylglycerol synthase family O-acyltransferase [Actinomycetota bacterium]